MSPSPTVSVIACLNTEHSDYFRTFRQLISDLPEDSEILLVGRSHPALVSEFPRIKPIPEAENHSTPLAFNVGAQQAKGDILLFAEGHFEPQPGWAAPLLAVLEHPEVGMAGPVLVPVEPTDPPLAGLTYTDAAMNTAWMTPQKEPYTAPVITGPILAMRRTQFESIGGFDPGFGENGFFCHDLSMRTWRAGKQCLIAPASKVSYLLPSYNLEGERWVAYLRDLIRMAFLHLETSELDVFLSTLQDSPAFLEARQGLSEDLLAQRSKVEAASQESAGSVLRRLCGSLFEMDDTKDLSSMLMEAEEHYAEVNRRAWAFWASTGAHTSTPVERNDLPNAKAMLDPFDWLPWDQFKSVLCLGAGGGKQAPLFASLGYETTLVDLSPEQLRWDRLVAEREGLSIEIMEGDMMDLRFLGARKFDLIYQPVSACYAPNLCALYQQVREHLAIGGLYRVEHWNPVQMQMQDHGKWDGRSYRLIHPQDTNRVVPWKIPGALVEGKTLSTWHFIHPLQDLIGGLLRAGLSIVQFAEDSDGNPSATPGSANHLAAFAPNFIHILSILK